LATPGLNVTPGPLTRSSFIDDVAIKVQLKLPGGDVFTDNMHDPSEIITQEITIAPGGHTGWHSHPGPVIVQVRSGTLTYYAGDDPTCTGRPYAAGTAFVDPGRGHVHIARNESTTTPLNFVAIYFDVPPGASPRIDAPAPGNCSF
jgi:quercetin dioxygenase-like cupin family protein